MADQPRTQKQIAQKYKDNLDYYKHGHFFRRLKLACFLLAVVVSLGAVFGFQAWGTKEYFNTGPISQNHARFANNCGVCHDGGAPDLARALKLDQAITDLKEGALASVDLDKVKNIASNAASSIKNFSAEELRAAAARNFSPEKLSELSQTVIKKSSLAGMDRACLKCHEPFKLHQPQSEAIGLRAVHPDLPLVHADRCSTCHREHVGHERMKFPGSETCGTCHADLEELRRTRNSIKIASPAPPTKSENRDIGDGLIRFIVPQEANAQPAVIKSYADGHPPFRFESPEARDPAAIKFGHVRHEQDDVKLDGRQLICSDCHQPGSGGVFYQPVKYEKNCQRCHSLGLTADLPKVAIPHGDPDKVRAFLRSIKAQYLTYFMREEGKTDRAELGQLVDDQVEKLRNRGMTTVDELERRVFFTGDPPKTNDRVSAKSNLGQVFPSCALCHEISGGDAANAPKFTKVNMAERWVNHGPFTHLPHKHMSCIDCHAGALQSEKTSDILMPPQKICAECHRPLQKDKVMEVVNDGVAPKPGTHEMADMQRREGGVKWECQSCHHFHAPPEAIQFLEAKAPPTR